jgi:3-oxoacyl-[acyl-carrier protein] reductase
MKTIDYKLKKKFALVTGGTHGIGLEIAKNLTSYGCNVAIFSRSQENLETAKAILEVNNTKILTIKGDALNESECNDAMDIIEKEWGELDILINNVGGGGRWGLENIEKTDPNVWKEVYNKNALAAAIFTQRSLPLMRKKKWGRVIAITSVIGKEGGGRPWFNMAKASQMAMIKSLSKTTYLVRDGITFNSVAPGGIYIEGTGFEDERNKNPKIFEEMVDKEYPLGRLGTPEEVAKVVCFLCSEMTTLVNGTQITVDGGQSSAY